MTIGQNQLVAIDWPPTGNDSNFGVQAMFDSIVNGTNIIDATQDGQLYVNTSSSTNYQFRHLIALPMTAWGIPNVCPLFEGSFTLQARSGPQQTDVYLGASILSTIPANSTSYIAVENTCPYFDPISTDVSNEWIWGYAIYTISTSNPTELAAYDVLALPKQEKLKFGLNESLLNQALNASYTGDDRTLLDLPFRIQTERGSVRVDLEVESQPDLVDSVIDAPAVSYTHLTLPTKRIV